MSGPSFARVGCSSDGREFGTACHRFLELADFGRLGSRGEVRGQLDALVSSERLAARQAELVPIDDVVWLSGTPEGALPVRHGGTAGREVPFVYALQIGETGEHTIVRGVIDCLVDTPKGLVVMDYKTDTLRSDDEFERRLAGYSVQLQLYCARCQRDLRAARGACGIGGFCVSVGSLMFRLYLQTWASCSALGLVGGVKLVGIRRRIWLDERND